jgi:lantibiotic modifying enzyme
MAAARAEDRPHLAVALDAARWIRASTVKTGHGVTWPADPAHPDAAATASPSLYSGAAGVVLFLIELHRATGDPADLVLAAAGADELLASLDRQAEAGFYSGLAGIGFVLNETGKATGESRHYDGARRVVASLKTRAVSWGTGVEWNDATDVVDGSAGIGLFLLYAARELDDPDARTVAARAGQRLVKLARPDEGGLKWARTRTATEPGVPALLPNFSHGTAGVAYFLATLYQETKEQAFLFEAIAGAGYLKAIARTDGDMCLVFHHEPEAAGRSLFYLGWCHGPAGTARLWRRLWQVTEDRDWLDWERKSAQAILSSGVPGQRTPGFWNNVGQCCGDAGVAEFFLALHRATGDPAHLAYADHVSAHLLAAATRDDDGARWIHAENRTQPNHLAAQIGWMQGAAGIAAWFLHRDAFARGAAPAITLPDSPW